MTYFCTGCAQSFEWSQTLVNRWVQCEQCDEIQIVPEKPVEDGGQVIWRGLVESVEDEAISVRLPDGRLGVVAVKEFTWSLNLSRVDNRFKVGDSVTTVILSEEDRLILSIKRVKPDPWPTLVNKYYPVGSRICGVFLKKMKRNRRGSSRRAVFQVGTDIGYEMRAYAGVPSGKTLQVGTVCTLTVKSIDINNRRVLVGLADGEDKPSLEDESPTFEAGPPEQGLGEVEAGPSERTLDTVDIVLFVGEVTYEEMLTGGRALQARSYAFDPLVSASAFQRLDVEQSAACFLETTDGSASELSAMYRRQLSRFSGSSALVITAKATAAEVMAAWHVATEDHVQAYFVPKGDLERLFSVQTMREVFYEPFKKNIGLLISQADVQMRSKQELSQRPGLAASCRELALASGLGFFVSDISSTYTKRKFDRPVWNDKNNKSIARRQADVMRRLGDLDFMVKRVFTNSGVPGSLGMTLRDADFIADLFRANEWLEIAVAAILNRSGLFIDIGLQVHVSWAKTKREVDVVGSTGKKLVLVECKSGGWQSADLDKLADLAQRLRSLAILVSVDRQTSQDLRRSASQRGLVVVHPTELEDALRSRLS